MRMWQEAAGQLCHPGRSTGRCDALQGREETGKQVAGFGINDAQMIYYLILRHIQSRDVIPGLESIPESDFHHF